VKIFQLNKPGRIHDVHSEDHVFLRELPDDWIIGAVMDGCSSGRDSYFPSTLFGKILEKSCKILPMYHRIDPEFTLSDTSAPILGKIILQQVFGDLKYIHDFLQTDLIEMLSTLQLMVYHRKRRSAWINISGDGYIVHDKNLIEIDQYNMPDYMAYHLDLSFDVWFDQHSQSYTLDNQSDISISTDGVSKFYSRSEKTQRSIDPAHYLLIDDTFKETDDMLDMKFKILKEEYGLLPYDDLGMIRIINK